MENQAEILDKEIAGIYDAILQNKVDIADIFIKVHQTGITTLENPRKMMEMIKEMDMMPVHITRFKENAAKLEILNKLKSELTTPCGAV